MFHDYKSVLVIFKTGWCYLYALLRNHLPLLPLLILMLSACSQDTEVELGVNWQKDTYVKRWTPKTGQWLRCKLRINMSPEGGHHDKAKKT